MKLDRNITEPRRGKYALIKLREVELPFVTNQTSFGEKAMVPVSAIDYGGSWDTDFFVIRLKDKYAGPALHAYAEAAKADDIEYAAEIDALAQAADRIMPKRMPD